MNPNISRRNWEFLNGKMGFLWVSHLWHVYDFHISVRKRQFEWEQYSLVLLLQSSEIYTFVTFFTISSTSPSLEHYIPQAAHKSKQHRVGFSLYGDEFAFSKSPRPSRISFGAVQRWVLFGESMDKLKKRINYGYWSLEINFLKNGWIF